MMAVKSEQKAKNQFDFAISTAVPESERPIKMITGPMTTGGNNRFKSRLPCHLTRALMTKYTTETAVKPESVPLNPHCLDASFIGAIKAKEEPKKIKLVKEMRNLDGSYIDERAIRNRVYEFFKDKYNLSNTKVDNVKLLETNGFIFGTALSRRYLTGKYTTLMEVREEVANYNAMSIEVNTHTHGIELQHNVDAIKKHVGLAYNKTSQILKTLFLKGFGNNKYKLLNLTLREYYAFIINNADLLKTDFIEFSGQRQDQLMFLENKTEEFKIPLEEHYRYVPFERYVKELESNVYKGYNTSMITDDFRSISERLFEKYCEKNENVKYVYKNGDTGQQYLSIVYGTNFDKQRLFYPDYIVQLKDETIWLIETKGGEKQGQSKNIDVQIENKFNAFKQFANKNEYNFGFVRDKNDELYLNNTEYVDDMNDENWKLLEEVF